MQELQLPGLLTRNFLLLYAGILGFITEATLRIRPLPEVRRYGSIVFHTFELGVQFMREVARQVMKLILWYKIIVPHFFCFFLTQRCEPASIRLMDNEQFQLGEVIFNPPPLPSGAVNSPFLHRPPPLSPLLS